MVTCGHDNRIRIWNTETCANTLANFGPMVRNSGLAPCIPVLAPAQNLVSRRSEGEADWKALQTTRNPASARGLFREFAATSLGDPSPPTWAYVMLQSHPTLAQRVAMADAWEQRGR